MDSDQVHFPIIQSEELSRPLACIGLKDSTTDQLLSSSLAQYSQEIRLCCLSDAGQRSCPCTMQVMAPFGEDLQ